jgi:hypothetical protein
MLKSMTNWFRRRSARSDGVDRGYTSFSDSDLEHGYRTPEDAMLERIQRGEHNTSETFDDLRRDIGKAFAVALVVVVLVVIIILMW